MKYNLIPSVNTDNSDIIFIYVLPSSFEGSAYSIAYPDCRAEDILSGGITIRIFDSCSSDALVEIEAEFKERLRKKHVKYAERLNTFLTAGIGVLIIGIINWVVPDPLPLVDELLFTIGGGLTAWKAWNDRKLKLPALVEHTWRYSYEGGKPEVETDNLLTAIFKSIRCRIDPSAAGEVIDGLDAIEIESLWMTRYLNIQDLLASGESNTSGFEDLMDVIERLLTVRKIVKLEERTQSRRVRARLHRLKQETIRKTGIIHDALDVYCEFYRAFGKYSAE